MALKGNKSDLHLGPLLKVFCKNFPFKTEKRKGDAEKFLKLVDNEESEAAEARPGWHRNKGVSDISRLIITTFRDGDFPC